MYPIGRMAEGSVHRAAQMIAVEASHRALPRLRAKKSIGVAPVHSSRANDSRRRLKQMLIRGWGDMVAKSNARKVYSL